MELLAHLTLLGNESTLLEQRKEPDMKLRYLTLTIAALLVSCNPSAVPTRPAADLQEKKWILLYIDEYLSPMVPGEESFTDGFKNLTLSFEQEQFGGYDGCNAFGGSYTVTATKLELGEIGGTTRGCDTEILAQAEAYLDELLRVTAYRTEGDRLELQDSDGRTTLTFTEADARYEVTLKLKADAKVELDAHSKIRVQVWGFDRYIADAPTTNLKNQFFNLPNLAVRPTVPFAEEDLLAVSPSSGDDEGLGYYVTFAIDADGDDRICTGDYRQAYDRTETSFFTKKDTGLQSLSVFIQKITDPSECEAF